MGSRRGCELCGKQGKLLLCSRCRETYYCCRDHQLTHWPAHSLVCIDLNDLADTPFFTHSDEMLFVNKPLSFEDFFETHLDTSGNKTHKLRTKDYCQEIIRELSVNLVNDMSDFGLCVIDNFLGVEDGMKVLNEVSLIHRAGLFQDGKLVKSQMSCKEVRGDKIRWVDGSEGNCSNITHLIRKMDAVVLRANRILGNRSMGDFKINGRTKGMVACYPGNGAHYVKHIDNPGQDGRCITAIYYLNQDWDVTKHGGLLRIFSKGLRDQVADIEPLFDRALFFWSDSRNPHEVQPSLRDRYAITWWYFDQQEHTRYLQSRPNKHKL